MSRNAPRLSRRAIRLSRRAIRLSRRAIRLIPRAIVFLAMGAIVLATSSGTAAAQDELDVGDIHGQTYDDDSGEPWIDPVTRFDVDPEDLPPPPDIELASLIRSDVLATGVAELEVDDDPLPAAFERHLRAQQVTEAIRTELREFDREIGDHRPRIERLEHSIDRHLQTERTLRTENAILREAITQSAITTFIGSDESETIGLDLGLDERTATTVILDDAVRRDHLDRIARNDETHAQSVADRRALERKLEGLRAEINRLRTDRRLRWQDLRAAEIAVDDTIVHFERTLHSRLDAFVVGTDIPLVAMNAYVIAERTLQETDPECGVQWWMLAGIGRIESLHGHFADSTLDDEGTTTDPIYGLPLDGRILSGGEELPDGVEAPEATGRSEETTVQVPAESVAPEALASAEESASSASAVPAAAETSAAGNDTGPGSDSAAVTDAVSGSDAAPAGDAATAGNAPVAEIVVKRLALILDTDGGRLDNDTVYDRAVGPMQFIPQTWSSWSADTDRDGADNPQNIYDAAVAAAGYLCAAANFTTAAGTDRALFAYNHDDDYTKAVNAAATTYSRLVRIDDVDEDTTDQPLTNTRPRGIADDPEDDVVDIGVSDLRAWLDSQAEDS